MELARRRRLLEQLASDPELQELFASHDLSNRRAVLRRAAVPRWVDAELYETVLLPDSGSDMPFVDFAALPEVDRTPGASDRCSVRESARTELLTEWSSDPDALRAFSRQVFDAFAHRGASELELLDLEFRFNPEAAAARFRRLYNSADSRADFPTCHSLIRLLNAHQGHVQEALRLYKEFEPLHRLRGLHLQAFYQTARYFARDSIHQRLLGFFRNPDSKWVLHIHGPGGMGKTMLISWLISRRLIRRKLAVPCVRFDCDHSSLSALKEHPWLLTLPFSEQLDPLLGDRFQYLASSFSPFRALMQPSASNLDADAYASLIASAPSSEVGWKLLVDKFREVRGAKPVVLLVDTLEDAALHQPEDVIAALTRLVELHEAAPNLRLILSGRYALGRERLPEAAALFGDSIEYAQLTRFEQGESEAFFRMLAPLAEESMVKAAAIRSHGNPFVLNLIAELVADDSSLDEAKLLDPNFDVALNYLIERVVLRIPEKQQLPVRWVIRYGVATRVLTEDYIGEVLLPFLELGLSGELARTGDDKIDEYLEKNPWPQGQSIPTAATIWGQLARYASTHGWVSMAEGAQPAVRFHSEVTEPMRNALRRQPVYQRLQEASAKWFLERGRWTDYLYHRLESDPAGVLEDCKQAFESAEVKENPAVQLMLAGELLHLDFASAPAEFHAFVHWKKAQALLAQRGYSLLLPASDLAPISAELKTARTFSQRPTVPPDIWVCLEAVSIHDSQGATAALEWLSNAEHSVLTDLHRAELQWRLGQEGAIETMGEAAARAEAQGGCSPPAWALYAKRSEWCARLALWPLAHEACLCAIRTAGTAISQRFQRELFELELSMGRSQQASLLLQRIEGIGPNQEPRDAALFDLYARLHAQWLRPVAAFEFALFISATEGEALAEKEFLIAETMRQQCRFTSAADHYTESQNEFEKAGVRYGIERGTLSKACMFAFDAGNLAEAQACLANLPPSTDTIPSRQAERALISAYLAAENSPPEARNILLQAVQAIPRAYRAVRPYLMLARLAFIGDEWSREEWEDLCAEIEAIEPASARIPLLEVLELGGKWPQAPAEIVDRLLQLFSAEGEGVHERQVFALRRAELLRCLRRPRESAALLTDRIPKPDSDSLDSHLVYRLRLQAETRLIETGYSSIGRADFEDSCQVFQNLMILRGSGAWRLTFLEGAFRVEMADRALWNDEREIAKKLLDEAGPLLGSDTLHTRYHARWAQLRALVSGEGIEEARRLWQLLGRSRMPPAAIEPVTPQPQAAPPRQPPPPAPVAQTWSVKSEVQTWSVKAEIRISPTTVYPNLASILYRDGRYQLCEPRQQPLDHPFANFPEVERLRTDRIPGWLFWQMAKDWQRVVEQLRPVVEKTLVDRDESAKRRRLWLDVESELLCLPWGFLRNATHSGVAVSYFGPIFSESSEINASADYFTYSLPTPLLAEVERRGDDPLPSYLEIMAGALRGLKDSISDPPPTVLLVLPEAGENRGEYRGLPELLSRRGVPFRLMREFHPAALRETLQHVRPEVVWLASGVIDSPSLPQPILTAGRTRPEDLARCFAQYEPRPGQKVTLILDAPLPESDSDAAQVFGARNRFAGELLRSKQFACVLATGLCQWEELERLHQTILNCLCEFKRQDETVDDIRAIPNQMTMEGRDGFRDWVPYLGACLFSNNPFYFIVPRITAVSQA